MPGQTIATLVLLIASILAIASSLCENFAHKCGVRLGAPLSNIDGSDVLQLAANGRAYYHFQIPTDADSVEITLSYLYGSVEVYVTNGRTPKPTDYDFSTIINGEQDYLKVMKLASDSANADYQLLIRAPVSTAARTILSVPGGTIRLVMGLPQRYTVMPGVPANFLFGLTSTNATQVVLTPLSINTPDMTLQRPRAPNAPYNYSSGYITFAPMAKELDKDFKIVVSSANETTFSIVVAPIGVDTMPIMLLDGAMPQQGKLHQYTEQYFVFHTPSTLEDTAVTFSLDSISGDADIYVNPGPHGFYHKTRDITDNPDLLPVWVSQIPSGRDAITIKPDDPDYQFQGGVYLVTVYGFRATEFVLRASSADAVVTLQEGLEIHGNVLEGGYQYFRFHDSQPYQTIMFDLQPTGGDADLYVSCMLSATGNVEGYPSKAFGHYNFSSIAYMEDALAISPWDPKSCSYQSSGTEVFYIAVYGYSDAAFSLNAMHGGGIRTLVAGVPLIGNVFAHMSMYYRIRVGSEAEDLRISLTTQFGDADLYVKINGLASNYDYDYRSGNIDTTVDEVFIPEQTICQNCIISVVVFGYRTSKYSLVASFNDRTILLYNGVPLKGSVEEDMVQYYAYQAVGNGSIHAVLTPQSGAPSLYMSRSAREPNATTSDTMSDDTDARLGNIPEVFLPGVSSGQTVYIGVAGAGLNSSYAVRVSEIPSDPTKPPTLLTLLDGIPQSDAIRFDRGGLWNYYRVDAPTGHEEIDVLVTAVIGNVNVYASRCRYGSPYICAANSLPNATYNIASSTISGQDSLIITRNDKLNTIYIIGVESDSYYSLYHISRKSVHTLLSLQSGVPVMDHVSAHETDYFTFYFDKPDEKFTIALAPLSGDPDLYVSLQYQHPSMGNSTWRAYDFGADSLTIDPTTDSEACVKCTYYIAVVGASESTYMLTVTLASTIPALIDGVATTGHVADLDWKFFEYYDHYGALRDVKLVLVSTIGNADLFVTLDGTSPSWENYAYKSTNFLTSDEIDIFHTDDEFAPCLAGICRLKVGIYGFIDSEFALTLTTTSTATLLKMGQVQRGSVAIKSYAYYRTILSQRDALSPYTLSFTVTPYSGHVGLYVSCTLPTPTAANYTWKLVPAEAGSVLDIYSVDAVDHGCTGSSTYFAGIYGTSSASFSIVSSMSGNDTVPMLQPGLATPGTVGFHTMKYYYVKPGQAYLDLRFTLTVLQGNVVAYVSKDWESRPRYSASTGTVVSYLYSSKSFGGNDMVLDHDQCQDLCKDRSNCYYIVGVWGTYQGNQVVQQMNTDIKPLGTASRYSILVSTIDSTISLQNGVAKRGNVAAGRTEYYHYAMTLPDRDLVLAVTPFYGDPDVFIGINSLQHPTKFNYTWSQTLFGMDEITLQYSEIKDRCTPDPVRGKACDFYFGVYGWVNSSYSIVVTTDEGYESPVLLIDEQPQIGSVKLRDYKYYKYFINVEPPSDDNSGIPISVKFTLTPTDDGDVDLYLIFGNRSEPGQKTYDYKSSRWSSVAEEIVISADMPHYCYSCEVFLAIFGYTEGSFVIQASSSGMTVLHSDLAVGGRVLPQAYGYYSYFNALPFGKISVTLTMISGDADLYISKFDPAGQSERNLHLPTKETYIWRSVRFGDDSIEIEYDDRNYCTNCEYLIGVYGYNNATFTILVTGAEATVVKLTMNRPQTAFLSSGKLQYFGTKIASSSADVTISLTILNTASADMYAQVYTKAQLASTDDADDHDVKLPTPRDPSTYQYSTVSSHDSHLFIPGPHTEETAIIIGVLARGEVKFTIVATSSATPVLLQAGIPQNHFVEAGNTEMFRFYPAAEESVRITLTARAGDPDLLVSQDFTNPHCVQGETSYQVQCSNFTWASFMYYTDQILISQEQPCEPFTQSTYVSADCNPSTSYDPGKGEALNIGVYGYADAQFTLLVVPTGLQIQLQPGVPQLSSTDLGVICSHRSDFNGACLADSRIKKKIQVGYFMFHVSTTNQPDRRSLLSTLDIDDAIKSVSDSIITVVPQCSGAPVNISDSSHADCAPGCDCNPLILYINSCPVSKCTEVDMRPSEIVGQHKTAITVKQGTGTTVFITSPNSFDGNIGNQNGAEVHDHQSFCDPIKAGEDCSYFIAVAVAMTNTQQTVDKSEASFTITARAPGDINLIPCISAASYPDGIRLSSIDIITNNGAHPHHYYEVCSHQRNSRKQENFNENLIVELDQCYGDTVIAACGDDNRCEDVLPSLDSYAYFSNSEKSCVHAADYHQKDDCHTVTKPTITLPQKADNYYLLTEGVGKFMLTVRTTLNGKPITPKLVYSGMHDDLASNLKLLKMDGNKPTLQWHQSEVLMPGVLLPQKAAMMEYDLYIYKTNDLKDAVRNSNNELIKTVDDFRFDTVCGVEYMASLLSINNKIEIVPVTVPNKDQGGSFMSHTINNLEGNTDYTVTIISRCDSDCLRQVSKTTRSPSTISCLGAASECKTQHLTYNTFSFVTGKATETNSGDSSDSTSMLDVLFSLGLVILIVIVITGGIVTYNYFKNSDGFFNFSNNRQSGSMTEMVDTKWFTSNRSNDNSPNTSTSGKSRTRNNNGSSAFSFTDYFAEYVNPQQTKYGMNPLSQDDSSHGIMNDNSSYNPPTEPQVLNFNQTTISDKFTSVVSSAKNMFSNSNRAGNSGKGRTTYNPVRGGADNNDDEIEIHL